MTTSAGQAKLEPDPLPTIIADHAVKRQQAAVMEAPSETWGETRLAFATPKVGRFRTAVGLRSFVEARVGKTQRPAAYLIVRSLPWLALGEMLEGERRGRWAATGARKA
jgi:long-chain acyl-CoA synthetase